MTTPGRSPQRIALAAGAVGLVGGLALGATGLASAVTPSSPPSLQQRAEDPGNKRPGGPDRKAHPAGRGGLVSAITSSSLTLRTPNGSKTVGLTESTTYYDGKEKATREVVAVGDVVRVRLTDPRATSPVASMVVVLPAHVAGWVTAKDGDALTITDRDGFARTIRTTSATTVTQDGAASTMSAVNVGSFIRATGDVAADDTTLNAERVALGAPKRGQRGPGQHPRGDQQVTPQA